MLTATIYVLAYVVGKDNWKCLALLQNLLIKRGKTNQILLLDLTGHLRIIMSMFEVYLFSTNDTL